MTIKISETETRIQELILALKEFNSCQHSINSEVKRGYDVANTIIQLHSRHTNLIKEISRADESLKGKTTKGNSRWEDIRYEAIELGRLDTEKCEVEDYLKRIKKCFTKVTLNLKKF